VSGREFLSDRTKHIPFSSIRKVFEEAKRLEAEGARIVHMEIGRPDFDTPANIKAAASRALEAGHVHYSSNQGIPELRQAIAEKLARENGIQVDPETGVVITIGCKEAILDTFLAFLNPGDEVLVPDPSWLEYTHTVEFLGSSPVSVPLRPERDFVLDPDDIAARITGKTKMLVLCSPHNPTGAVMDEETVRALADLCIQHDLLVLSDEIYEKMVYDGARHISIGSLPGMSERTITINGFSKAYAMDGWRLGYAAGAKSLIQPILKVHQYTTTCANTFAQFGAVEAYRGPQDAVAEMVAEFDRRRTFLVEQLNEIPGVSCVVPRGSFYTFPTFHGYGMDSQEMATYLLREAHIACVPGSAFGTAGEGHIRLAYSTDFESIELGLDRMREVLAKLRR
jgi:aminotransferase